MKIIIETIPHETQRYPTVGDWFYETEIPIEESGKVLQPIEVLHIKVSEFGDWRQEALVAVHELAECLMCKQDGVTQQAVDAFDKKFEEERASGQHSEVEEPGDSLAAPYRKQHGIASAIERLLGAELGVDWNAYADKVESMP